MVVELEKEFDLGHQAVAFGLSLLGSLTASKSSRGHGPDLLARPLNAALPPALFGARRPSASASRSP